jgi:hypothetical protein
MSRLAAKPGSGASDALTIRSIDALLVVVPMRRALGTSVMAITEAPLASPLVGQEFPVQDDNDPVAARVGFAPDIKAEVDRAHDAVTEFLVNEFP